VKALVTGGAGFVGRHLTRALLDRGYDVETVDLDAMWITSTGRHRHFISDVRDFFRSDTERYDLVLHCAAVVGGRRKIEGAPLDLAVDLAIDADMFTWALSTRPGKVVYFSSSAAYPVWLQARDRHAALREDDLDLDHIATPDHVYGWTKLTGELLARHAQAAGLDVLVVRPFSGFGTDQALDYPFPAFIDRAMRRADPFDVWGDGEQVRDFIHIDDVVGAVFAAIDQNIEGPVNLGTGRATSFNDLAAMVCAAAGYEPSIRHLPAEPVGVQYRVCDPTRMLGFYTPTVSLEQGIDRALRAKAIVA
jgi:nucleoside-diphosphate-sugar epimerase